MTLASHPHHSCAGVGQNPICQPPWHFFGWFDLAEDIPAMQTAQRVLEIPMRFDETPCPYPSADPACIHIDVWVHEQVVSLAAFWDVWDIVKTEKRQAHEHSLE